MCIFFHIHIRMYRHIQETNKPKKSSLFLYFCTKESCHFVLCAFYCMEDEQRHGSNQSPTGALAPQIWVSWTFSLPWELLMT